MQVYCCNPCFLKSLKSVFRSRRSFSGEVPVFILSGLQEQNIDEKVFRYPKRRGLLSKNHPELRQLQSFEVG